MIFPPSSPTRTSTAETGPAGPVPDSSLSAPAVSIVIVNWNTCDLLRGCLTSVQAQTTQPREIIVVDNASSDGSPAMVGAEFPEVVLIANPDNRGFAAANNQGLQVARGKNLLLLNPDTVVLDHAIDRMLAWLADHPDVGCVGCQVLEGPATIQLTCFADPGLVNQTLVELGLMRLARWIPFTGRPWYVGWDRRSARDVDVVSGMFMLVPRRVVEKVGLLDEAFFIYAEEADWCRRIRKAGWRCVFAPEAQIIHLDGGSKSTVQIRSRMYVQMQKSHLFYLRKHGGPLAHAAMKAVFVGSALLRGALFGLQALIRQTPVARARTRLAAAALRYHLAGQEPQS
jgi:GT2 family glycosyltransferase